MKCDAWAWNADLRCLVNSKKHCWIYAGLITGIHVSQRHHLHYSCRTVLTPGDLLHEATPAGTRLHIVCKQKTAARQRKVSFAVTGKTTLVASVFQQWQGSRTRLRNVTCNIRHNICLYYAQSLQPSYRIAAV